MEGTKTKVGSELELKTKQLNQVAYKKRSSYMPLDLNLFKIVLLGSKAKYVIAKQS